MQEIFGGSLGVFIAVFGALLFFVIGLILGRSLSGRVGGDKGAKERQDQFIMLASHYLLTPLSIIQTALSALQEGDLTIGIEQRRRLYEAILAGQKRLWIVAEEMVLVNEIEHQSLEPQLMPSDVGEVVSAAIADVDVFARAKSLTINFHDSSGQFHEARLDARRMRQAVIAIIDNAIKFSDIGQKIEINLSHDSGYYTLRVQDNGIGMNKETMARVGERFYRGSSLYNFNYEGMGLGLYIAYAIFKMHSGSMSIASEQGKGAVVTARFPML